MLRKSSKVPKFSPRSDFRNKRDFSLVESFRPIKKGFSLIELIVVIAIIGILVMLASPRFLGRTKEATLTKHLYNVKTLEDTMDRYVLENDRFPRLSEEAYTSEEVEEYANRIRDITGEEITLDPEGKYYDIDYVTLKDYIKVPDKRDMPNYILQNPVGKVFFLEELTEIASGRTDFTVSNPSNEKNNNPINLRDVSKQVDFIKLKLEGITNNSTEEDFVEIKDLISSALESANLLSNKENVEILKTIYNLQESLEGIINNKTIELIAALLHEANESVKLEQLENIDSFIVNIQKEINALKRSKEKTDLQKELNGIKERVEYQKEVNHWVSKGYELILTPQDLQDVKRHGNYVQMNNLNMSGFDFSPIPLFQGTYIGKGFSIQNLKIIKPNESDLGIFKSIVNATITNVRLSNYEISGKYNIGTLAGNSKDSTITGYNGTGKVSGRGNYGAPVGSYLD